MADIFKDKETGKWYAETDFLGTIFTEEITNKKIIKQLEESEKEGEKLLDEAIETGAFDKEYDEIYQDITY